MIWVPVWKQKWLGPRKLAAALLRASDSRPQNASITEANFGSGACVCSALVKVWLLSPLLHRDGDIPTLENKGKHLTKHHSLFHFAVVVLCCSCCRLWLSNNFPDLFSVFLKELICQCLLANQTLHAVLQTHKTLTTLSCFSEWFLQIPPKLFWV